MKLNINEKKALYTFGCPNHRATHRATVDRLQMLAAITPDPVAGELFNDLAIKLSTEEAHDWYRRFYRTLRMEMDGYYEAELTLRLAEIGSYDMEGDYGEADEV